MQTSRLTVLLRTSACSLLCLTPFWAETRGLAVNRQLALTSIAVEGANLTLVASVPAGLGPVTLEMRPTLAAPWKPARLVEVPAGGGEVTLTLPKPGEMQFFRLNATSTAETTGALSPEVNYVILPPLGLGAESTAADRRGSAGAKAQFHFRGWIDGSDRILITREGASWEHAHWDWPLGAVTVNRTRWDPSQKNYLSTAGAAKFLPERFSLEAAELERIKGRDVVALERTNNALVVYLDDTPVGAGEYEFKIPLPRCLAKARPRPGVHRREAEDRSGD